MTGGGEEVGICGGGGDRGLSAVPRPLAALLRRASACEMESSDGALRSSSRESDRQISSDGDGGSGGGGRAMITEEVDEAAAHRAGGMDGGGLRIHTPSSTHKRTHDT